MQLEVGEDSNDFFSLDCDWSLSTSKGSGVGVFVGFKTGLGVLARGLLFVLLLEVV